jgi:hypothetical protein
MDLIVSLIFCIDGIIAFLFEPAEERWSCVGDAWDSVERDEVLLIDGGGPSLWAIHGRVGLL